MAEVIGDAGRRFERRVFSGTDHWGVLADGSLWVARVYHNRVDVRSPDGRWTKGQPLPDRVLEVTRFDRELFFRKFPPELRATAERLHDTLAGHGLACTRLGIEAVTAHGPELHRQGRLLREIRVPGPGRILAVGDRTALVAERVRDGTRFVLFRLTADEAGP